MTERDPAEIEAELRLDLLLVSRFKSNDTMIDEPFNPGSTYRHAMESGLIKLFGDNRFVSERMVMLTQEGVARRMKLLAGTSKRTDTDLTGVTLEIEAERLRRMKRENDVAEGKLVPVDAALRRHEEKLDEALGMLRSLMPQPLPWNLTCG
ncbi:MAG: hypothetical protein EOP19_06775 [Hyphomicrobiales bacterium]|nr:MAG: hypothetical protein EOP19_06775 [Hyphomicrobiales bacterium]